MTHIIIEGQYIVNNDLIRCLELVIEQLKTGNNEHIEVKSNVGTRLEMNFHKVELEDLRK